MVSQSDVRHIMTEVWRFFGFKSVGLLVRTIARCVKGMHALSLLGFVPLDTVGGDRNEGLHGLMSTACYRRAGITSASKA